MYKRMSYDELCTINSNFFKNLKALYVAKNCTYFKELLRTIFEEGDMVYFLESNDMAFTMMKNGDNYVLVDEKEKIELHCDLEDINKIHNFLKNDKNITKVIKNNDTILESLLEGFIKNEMIGLLDKPYLVYDIETYGSLNNLKTLKFVMGYSIISSENHEKSMKYRYIDETNLKKFVDFMLGFDGYIVGFNNISFDNQVVCYSSGYEQDKIDILNSKSIDVFLFLRNLTGNRYSLDKVATALIGVSKTLSSGGVETMVEYQKTKDEKLLSKLKSYCKNDVKMTLGSLLYLLKNRAVYIEGEHIDFDISMMVDLGCRQRKKDSKEADSQKTIFSD